MAKAKAAAKAPAPPSCFAERGLGAAGQPQAVPVQERKSGTLGLSLEAAHAGTYWRSHQGRRTSPWPKGTAKLAADQVRGRGERGGGILPGQGQAVEPQRCSL